MRKRKKKEEERKMIHTYLNNFKSHTVISLECPGLNFPNSGYHTFVNGF